MLSKKLNNDVFHHQIEENVFQLELLRMEYELL